MPTWIEDIPWPVWAYVGVSVPTFLAYGWDKYRASKGGQRVPESTLHLLELFGGWPGAFIGQRVFRHKTVKRSFQILFWLIGAAHVLFWMFWLGRP